jgi:hypothetical protein
MRCQSASVTSGFMAVLRSCADPTLSTNQLMPCQLLIISERSKVLADSTRPSEYLRACHPPGETPAPPGPGLAYLGISSYAAPVTNPKSLLSRSEERLEDLKPARARIRLA